MMTSLFLAGWKFLTLLALGFCLAFGVVGYASRKRRGLHRLANTAPSLSVTAYDPNAATHKDSRLSFIADAAISVPYTLVTIGATAGKTVKANTASSEPLGIVEDTTDSVDNDLTVPIHVRLFSGTGGTTRVAVNSTVAVGDYLIPDTSNPIYGMTDPLSATGGRSFNRFARALEAGVAGQVIEIEPFLPTKTAGGTFTSAGSLTSEAIVIAGFLATDNPVCTLASQTSTETLKHAAAASGQINLTYSASSGTSTITNWIATRA